MFCSVASQKTQCTFKGWMRSAGRLHRQGMLELPFELHQEIYCSCLNTRSVPRTPHGRVQKTPGTQFSWSRKFKIKPWIFRARKTLWGAHASSQRTVLATPMENHPGPLENKFSPICFRDHPPKSNGLLENSFGAIRLRDRC